MTRDGTHLSRLPAALGFATALLPLGVWYGRRMSDGSDEPLGIIALLAALGLAWANRHALRSTRAQQMAGLLLLAVYGITVGLALPPLLRSLPALAAVACWSGLWRIPSATMLLGLSLPVMASLQFYLGYPMRVAAAGLSTATLQVFAIPVERVGTQLMFNGVALGVDAPCSGIRMLWMTCFFGAIIGAMLRLGWRQAIALVASSGVVAILANSLRATLLFFPESGMIRLPSWTHEGTGLMLHVLAMATLLAFARRLPSSPLPSS